MFLRVQDDVGTLFTYVHDETALETQIETCGRERHEKLARNERSYTPLGTSKDNKIADKRWSDIAPELFEAL